MDSQYKKNMESFNLKVVDMLKFVNELVKKPHTEEIPGEHMIETKGQLDLE